MWRGGGVRMEGWRGEDGRWRGEDVMEWKGGRVEG